MSTSSSANGQSESRGKDETRARILMAARDCFSRHGFERTTVKMIAAHCGLTDAAIYYYFPSKRHVLEALWTIRPNRGVRGITVETPLTVNRFREINDAVLDFLADNHQTMRLMIRSTLDGDEVARALRSDNRAGWRRTLFEHFRTLASEDDASFLTELVMSYVTGASMRSHMELGDDFMDASRSGEFREEIHRACLELLDLPLATTDA